MKRNFKNVGLIALIIFMFVLEFLLIKTIYQKEQTDNDIEKNSQTEQIVYDNGENLLHKGLNYEIVRILKKGEFKGYSYKINGRDTILAQGITEKPPWIVVVGDSWNIVRMRLAYGSNSFDLQYFDVHNNIKSQVFFSPEAFAEFSDNIGKNALVAYYEYDENKASYSLVIRNIFDDEFNIVIERNFGSILLTERMIFLNKNQLYIEYHNDNGELIKETIAFTEDK